MSSQQIDRASGLVGSIAIKAPCRAATIGANITLSGTQTLDGVTLVAAASGTLGDRVLVKDQTDATTNGIYQVQTGPWTREPDFDGVYDVAQGTLVLIAQGSQNASTVWQLTTVPPITVGQSPGVGSDLTFSQNLAFTSLITMSTTGLGIGLSGGSPGTGDVIDAVLTANEPVRFVLTNQDTGSAAQTNIQALAYGTDATGGEYTVHIFAYSPANSSGMIGNSESGLFTNMVAMNIISAYGPIKFGGSFPFVETARFTLNGAFTMGGYTGSGSYSNGQLSLIPNATYGAVFTGQGSSFDAFIQNGAGNPYLQGLAGAQSVILGQSAPATTATSGFVYIPAVSGTPTGTPTAVTGYVPICYDTSGNKIWVYNGAWKAAAAS